MTQDGHKTKAELLQELNALRHRISELEQTKQGFKESEKQVEKELNGSEQLFKSIFNNAADGILLADVENKRFHSCNKMICQMSGYTEQELKNLTITDIHPKKDQPYVQEQFDKQVRGEFTLAKDIPIKKKDGNVFYVDINSFPVNLGEKKYLMGIFRDITERKKAEEQIRKLSAAVEQSIDGIAIGDLEPRLLYVNKAYARMHDYKPKEMIGMPVKKLHNKQQICKYQNFVKQIKTQGSWDGEIGHIKKDGTAFPTYMSVTLLKNNEEKSIGILAVARDVTEAKHKEKELNIYRERMAHTEQLVSVGTISATIAHELTQPLTVVRLSIENSLAELQDVPYLSSIIEQLNVGLSGCSDIASIVKRFRDFAVTSSGENQLEKIYLNTLLEMISKLLDERAWRTKVTIQLKDIDKLPYIYSNEQDLEQLFYALMENAVEAADGKKNRHIIISGVEKDENIELRFSDNCGGIARENLDRIFEPFFTTKQVSKSTGLGLCVVQSIISRANGDIQVESKAGEGSTFFVTLPINSIKKSRRIGDEK